MLQRIISLILLICLCITPVLAHPGRTDASGGHWDHSTGTYHYHHGHAAHQHYDMDGDGVPDCPYNFQDDTSHRSGSTSSSRSASQSSTASSASIAPSAQTTSPSPTSAVQNEQKQKGNASMVGWIVSAVLFLALLFSEKSHSKDQIIQNGVMQKKEKLLQERTEEISSQASRISELEETILKQKAKIEQIQAEKEKIQQKLDAVFTGAAAEDGETLEEKNLHLFAQITEQKDLLHEKECRIFQLVEELDKHIQREKVPRGVFYADDGMPAYFKSASKKYGDYTAFLNRRTNVYHLDPKCAPADAAQIHVFKLPSSARACSKCAPNGKQELPVLHRYG